MMICVSNVWCIFSVLSEGLTFVATDTQTSKICTYGCKASQVADFIMPKTFDYSKKILLLQMLKLKIEYNDSMLLSLTIILF
jgi:hypothetical protein